MDELRESLDLPKIGGELIVYSRSVSKPSTRGGCWPFGRHKKLNQTVYEWRAEFVFPGPDSRYNPGVAMLSTASLKDFINDLDQALQKMIMLEKQSFSGTYSKSFGNRNFFPYPQIEVKAEDGKVWLQFWASSKTYRFSRQLSSNEVSTAINKLKTVEGKAQKMIQTLKTLVSNSTIPLKKGRAQETGERIS